jgi:hypothetical protein
MQRSAIDAVRVPAALLRQQRQTTKSSFAGLPVTRLVAALAHAVSRYDLSHSSAI